ncbi:MAG: DNA (cytosine-5-)-methyltransferase [Kurthia gibsonii]|uniref:Cytosine-specific methyltransferase n=1 Tax=Kurthia gibsonii TaxID=33946 RepID=A0ABU9LKN9_9BACL|nr:DNA (cytosine-5-)-methyltransferase [Kurthia gibsonii]MEB6112526.1 DNA (cytosine-5-)-methyltransferase [Kurthia gibsonii]MEB7772588.1 DNA (cytosine-5-)-methyltransferase [Kurthia gibsonii]RXH51506.1 DNA (cytosine-5-)-methyltransferase [Kurthia gibsonii]
MKQTINVVELFAGVGGFRLGLEKANKQLFKTVWANQWEPSKKVQHAFDCYTHNFKEGYASNEDITSVPDETFQNLNIDLLVGGFPCQDYSVARSLSKEEGIKGKKGVLFWDIKRVLENSHPKYVLLENVDRLLKSPSKQRGRDFAVMLATFRDLNYIVEWRVINAAEYGHAQRRRRVFIFAYKENLDFAKKQSVHSQDELIYEKGFFAQTFPVQREAYKNRRMSVTLPEDIVDISDNFSFEFHLAGRMEKGNVHTIHTIPQLQRAIPLGEILENEVDEKYYLTEAQIEKFAYLRGPKKIERTSADGHKYIFSEGGMSPVDDLALPGRTMLTSEASVNRSTHIVEIDGRKRFLTPVECERLNSFPDNWTANIPERMRYFTMGNALVVNLVKDMAKTIEKIESLEQVTDTQLELHLN